MAGTALLGRIRLCLARLLWRWIPHRTQREWLLDEHPVKVAACGRRWGKTEAAAVDAATYAICRPGSVQMIVSPTYDQSKLIFDTVERLLCGTGLTRKFTKVVRTPYPRITVRGSLVMARTADEDGRNLRGHSADRVIVDEAAYVKDAVIDEVIAPMLADRDGQLVLISTPAGRNHFYRAFMRGLQPTGSAPGGERESGEPVDTGPVVAKVMADPNSTANRYASFRFPSRLNPHISQSYIEHQRAALTDRQFRVEYEAEFLDDRNAVFPWSDIQNAIYEIGSLKHPELVEGCGLGERALRQAQDACVGEAQDAQVDLPAAGDFIVAGVDWARYSDFTAVVILDASDAPFRVLAMDRFHGLPWSAQIERVADLLETQGVSLVLTDQTSVGDPLLEQLRGRLVEGGRSRAEVRGLIFTAQSKRELMDNLVIKLAHGQVKIPNDERLVQELQYFEFEMTPMGNLRMNARTGYHDDLVIALALAALVASADGVGPAGFMTSGTATESGAGW